MNQTSDNTAAALRHAARKIFTQRGYDAASVRAIVREAGANLGAITYHYGSKRALYGAVLAETLSPFAERVVAAAAAEGAPLARLEAVLRTYFEVMGDHPEVPRMLLQELVVGREPPPEVIAVFRRVFAAVGGAIREGQADGSIRGGDPALMLMSLISQPVMTMVARQMLRMVAGVDPADPDTRARVVEHAAGFVRAGLSARLERREDS